MTAPKRQVENTIPILRVRDLASSLCFYNEKLGFSVDWGGKEGETIASVSRDGCCLMLSQDGRGIFGSWVWIGVENDSIFTEIRQAGVRIVQEPKNRPWAYEMKIADPDGNILWLGTESKPDEPFAEDTPSSE